MQNVFPACAGVILMAKLDNHGDEGIPRMRGGDPDELDMYIWGVTYSPHARG